MTMWQFASNHPYVFTFIVIWIAAIALQMMGKGFNRFMRHLNVRKHGWPPAHLDADGDWRPGTEAEAIERARQTEGQERQILDTVSEMRMTMDQQMDQMRRQLLAAGMQAPGLMGMMGSASQGGIPGEEIRRLMAEAGMHPVFNYPERFGYQDLTGAGPIPQAPGVSITPRISVSPIPFPATVSMMGGDLELGIETNAQENTEGAAGSTQL